ncbi:cupin domain-containing protein [Cryobacterium adonitolivorans]|uniref:Cupin domain-containing protein n=2 Tax=Cryobacterium adonitolivorans TaxID=1259189 RepID=A0A4R8W190_9MICO|nr:cupin domain-containing protein [Cryobacterium adonitolivorans]
MSTTTHTLQVKSHNTPDERRAPALTLLELNHLDEFSVGRMTMQPGWTWADNIKPTVNTESCQLLHVGYCLSGTLETVLDAGTTATITVGDSYLIPPGHNARVVGDEPYVAIEMHSAASYGVPTEKS